MAPKDENNLYDTLTGGTDVPAAEGDFSLEEILAAKAAGTLDTLLLPARAEHLHISSTMVRDMIRYHQPLDNCMPAAAAAVLQRIREGKVQ